MGRQMPGEKYNCVFMYFRIVKVRRFYIPIVFVNIYKKRIASEHNFIGSIWLLVDKFSTIRFFLHPRENYLLYEVQNFEYILLDTYSIILHLFRSIVHSVI